MAIAMTSFISMHGRVIWILANNSREKLLLETPQLNISDGESAVFSEPWEAQAFAIVVTLSDSGYFTWEEWSSTLSETISRAEADGGPRDGSDYYFNWVTALEQILERKNLADNLSLASVKAEWEQAYKLTPHGKPVFLNKRSQRYKNL